MSTKVIEFVVTYFPQCKLKVPDGFTSEFYHTFKGEVLPILHKLLQNTEGNTSQLILWEQHHSYTKTWLKYYKKRQAGGKEGKKEENYRPMPLVNIDIKILKS